MKTYHYISVDGSPRVDSNHESSYPDIGLTPAKLQRPARNAQHKMPKVLRLEALADKIHEIRKLSQRLDHPLANKRSDNPVVTDLYVPRKAPEIVTNLFDRKMSMKRLPQVAHGKPRQFF